MSSDGFKRSVKAQRHDRAAGDAPSMGKVARMPGTGLPKGTRRKKRKSEGARGNRLRQSRKRVIASWSFLLSSLVFLILALFVWLWLIPKMDPLEKNTAITPENADKEVKVASKFPSPPEAVALATVKQALALRDPQKVSAYFRPGSATPAGVIGFLQGLDALDGPFERSEWLSSMDANGLSIDGVLVTFKGIDKPRNRLALLTPDAEGKWKIDFDAFARTVSPSWGDLLEKNAPVAQVRVYIAKDTYYNGPFIDDDQWNCYGIASPDNDQILQAYCKTGSPQASAMAWIFSRESSLTRATLEIRRVEGGEARQFEITKVLAEDWVMGAVPFDEGFK